MIIAIGADHRGFAYKELIKKQLTTIKNEAILWRDHGAQNTERSDYPLFAQAVCNDIIAGNAQYGVLLCATGVGMAVAANRFSGIYAALVWNVEIAKLARAHDNANVLVIPTDFVSSETAILMIRTWLETSFLGERYEERIKLID